MTTATKTSRPRLGELPPETIREGLTLAERNGLRYVAGCGRAHRKVCDLLNEDGEEVTEWVPARLFPPPPEVLDELLRRELIEPHPLRYETRTRP